MKKSADISGSAFVRRIVLYSVFLFALCYAASAHALVQVGQQSPSFVLQELGGQTVQLSDFVKKKAVIVLFWSTWSERSRKALMRMEEFHRAYKDRGIQVVGINADNQTMSAADVEAVGKFAKELGISFPLLLDHGLKTFYEFGVIALPSTVVVSEGKIIFEMPGLPLVGTEDMFDYLKVLAGDAPRRKIELKYRPLPAAVTDATLAHALVLKKRYEMAYTLYKKAIEKDPGFVLPYIELSKLYQMEDKNQEAGDILKKALAVEPQNAAAMSELGYLQARTGRLAEAVALLEMASKTGSYTPALYYYAYALGMSGKLREAWAAFDQALALNPFDTAIYTLRGGIYEKNNMLREASADYRKTLEILLKIK